MRTTYAARVRMTQLLYISMAIGVGVGSAMQVSMVGSLGRVKGPTEAAWISLMATVLSISLALALRSLVRRPPDLPSPFDNAYIFVVLAVCAGIALSISIRGLSPYLAMAGIFGFIYLACTAFLAPRIGIALFASAATAGTLSGSVGLDHIGAFGADVHRLTFLRLCGIAALLVGVVFVRSGR